METTLLIVFSVILGLEVIERIVCAVVSIVLSESGEPRAAGLFPIAHTICTQVDSYRLHKAIRDKSKEKKWR